MKFFSAIFFIFCLSLHVFGGPSLWLKNNSTERSMFANRSARFIGDQLEIIITDKGKFTIDYKSDLTKKVQINDAVTQWLFPPAVSGFGTHKGYTPSSIMNGNDSYKGEWKLENEQKFEDYRFSVNVVDVRPNGSLVVSGSRRVEAATETYYIKFTGTVRVDDVRADNTVDSTKVANARFSILGEGELTNQQNPGFISEIYDVVHPF